MPTEPALETVALILEAYKRSLMQPEVFGSFLGKIADDFRSGEIGKPERPN